MMKRDVDVAGDGISTLLAFSMIEDLSGPASCHSDDPSSKKRNPKSC